MTDHVQDGQGSSALEFALLAPALILLFTGLAAIGVLAQTAMVVRDAARAGARAAALSYVNPDPRATVKTYLDSAFAGRTDVSYSVSSITITPPAGQRTVGGYVTVSLPVTVQLPLPYIKEALGTAVTVTGAATMRVSQ